MHISKNISCKKDLKINKLYCKYNIKKDGSILFLSNPYDSYLCINDFFLENTLFPNLYGQTENIIINKLLILYSIQKKNLKYIDDIYYKNRYIKKNKTSLYIDNDSRLRWSKKRGRF